MANVLKALSAVYLREYSRVTTAWPPAAKRLRAARPTWHRTGLFLAELAGVVLTTFGIAQWSWPSALVIGGLVLVAAIEVRPSAPARMPAVLPPEDLLRHQAENAAVIINNERYGLAFADADQLAQLTVKECEQLVVMARNLGVKT